MRSVIFLVHAVISIWLMTVLFQKKECYVKPTLFQDDDRLLQHDRDAYVLGAWVNVPMMLTLIEWIAASFALYVLDIPNMLDPTNDENLGLHSNVLLCTLWNIVFLIVMWMNHTDLYIPANNIFLYVLAIIATIAVQNFMARAKPAAEALNAKKNDYRAVELEDKGFWKTDARRAQQNEHLEFHDRSYVRHLDESPRGLVCRMCHEAIAMPLFFLVMFSIVPGSLTWVAQTVFVLQIMLNLNIILQSFTETMYNSLLYLINVIFCCLGSMAAFYAPAFPLLFTGDSPVPVYARILVFLMLLMWIVFAFLWTFDYHIFYKHDVYDWLTLAFKLVYVVIIANNVCNVC